METGDSSSPLGGCPTYTPAARAKVGEAGLWPLGSARDGADAESTNGGDGGGGGHATPASSDKSSVPTRRRSRGQREVINSPDKASASLHRRQAKRARKEAKRHSHGQMDGGAPEHSPLLSQLLVIDCMDLAADATLGLKVMLDLETTLPLAETAGHCHPQLGAGVAVPGDDERVALAQRTTDALLMALQSGDDVFESVSFEARSRHVCLRTPEAAADATCVCESCVPQDGWPGGAFGSTGNGASNGRESRGTNASGSANDAACDVLAMVVASASGSSSLVASEVMHSLRFEALRLHAQLAWVLAALAPAGEHGLPVSLLAPAARQLVAEVAAAFGSAGGSAGECPASVVPATLAAGAKAVLVEPLAVPPVVVGHSGDLLSILPTALPHWADFNLEPHAGPRTVHYHVVCPDAGLLKQQTRAFLHELSSAYSTLRLGYLQPTPYLTTDGNAAPNMVPEEPLEAQATEAQRAHSSRATLALTAVLEREEAAAAAASASLAPLAVVSSTAMTLVPRPSEESEVLAAFARALDVVVEMLLMEDDEREQREKRTGGQRWEEEDAAVDSACVGVLVVNPLDVWGPLPGLVAPEDLRALVVGRLRPVLDREIGSRLVLHLLPAGEVCGPGARLGRQRDQTLASHALALYRKCRLPPPVHERLPLGTAGSEAAQRLARCRAPMERLHTALFTLANTTAGGTQAVFTAQDGRLCIQQVEQVLFCSYMLLRSAGSGQLLAAACWMDEDGELLHTELVCPCPLDAGAAGPDDHLPVVRAVWARAREYVDRTVLHWRVVMVRVHAGPVAGCGLSARELEAWRIVLDEEGGAGGAGGAGTAPSSAAAAAAAAVADADAASVLGVSLVDLNIDAGLEVHHHQPLHQADAGGERVTSDLTLGWGSGASTTYAVVLDAAAQAQPCHCLQEGGGASNSNSSASSSSSGGARALVSAVLYTPTPAGGDERLVRLAAMRGVCGRSLALDLRLHQPVLGGAAGSKHALGSDCVHTVARYLCQRLNAHSWLTVDPVSTRGRRSHLPNHVCELLTFVSCLATQS